jgi:nucleoside-diphosphate-sugar epimerase
MKLLITGGAGFVGTEPVFGTHGSALNVLFGLAAS